MSMFTFEKPKKTPINEQTCREQFENLMTLNSRRCVDVGKGTYEPVPFEEALTVTLQILDKTGASEKSDYEDFKAWLKDGLRGYRS